MATSVSRDIEALLLSMLLNQAVIFTLITRSIVSVDRVKRGSPQPETQGNQRINSVKRANRQRTSGTKFNDFIMG